MPELVVTALGEAYDALLPLFKSDFSPRLRRVTAEVLGIKEGESGVTGKLVRGESDACDNTDVLEVVGERSFEIVAVTKLVEWGEAVTAEIRKALAEPGYAQVASIVQRSANFWPEMPLAKFFPVYPEEG